MTLWLVLAAMTAAAMIAIMRPLGRNRTAASSGSDVAVYRDQLEEIERERVLGRIGPAEAEAARAEVSRRLIAAVDCAVATDPNAMPFVSAPRHRRIAAAILVALPIGVLGLYLMLGSPQLPGQPIADRQSAGADNQDIEALIAQTEVYLE